MSSKRKVLWHVPSVGQLRCLKKDESKVTFWIESHQYKSRQHLLELKGPTKGPFFINCRDVPTWWLQERITAIAELVHKWSENPSRYYLNCSPEGWIQIYQIHAMQALDYLFAELGRRAK